MLAIITAIFFIGMGVLGLCAPRRVALLFGQQASKDGRNEIRAVYGGFGIAIGGLILYRQPDILPIAAFMLLSMAAGRVIGFIIERPDSRWPAIFFSMEITLGGLLLWGL